MLSELRITGLGAIAEASAHFAPGLTVVTGETGAGKTMIVTGLRLISGRRADASRVRTGVDRAVAEARFDTTDLSSSALAELHEVIDDVDGAADDDGSIIVARRVGADGRSKAQLAGRAAPASSLARATAPLLTVHGQNDQLRLLRPDAQRAAVDIVGGKELAAVRTRYFQAYRQFKEANFALTERTSRSRELAQEAAMLRHGLQEISGLAPRPGEDGELVDVVRRLTQSASLRQAASSAQAVLQGEVEDSGDLRAVQRAGPGVIDSLDGVAHELEGAQDSELSALATRLRVAMTDIAEIGTELGIFLADLPEANPDTLHSALERQAALKSLTRTYAEDIEGVLQWAESSNARLAEIDTSDSAIAQLRADVERHAALVGKEGRALSKLRHSAAKGLEIAVAAELAELSMAGQRLTVSVTPLTSGTPLEVRRARANSVTANAASPASAAATGSKAGTRTGTSAQAKGQSESPHPGFYAAEHGLDDISFTLGGDGIEGVPIAKGASGGELSRIMLALEVVLAADSTGGTLVFDEVDAGVGGRAAVSIGKRLALLATRHQVIVVTHLPQVAAFGDHHLMVVKAQSAISGVVEVSGNERIAELARMLAGLDDTDSGIAHARELSSRAAEFTSGLKR